MPPITYILVHYGGILYWSVSLTVYKDLYTVNGQYEQDLTVVLSQTCESVLQTFWTNMRTVTDGVFFF